MLKEQEEFGRFSLKKFYIRRLLRIWPVYYVVLLFGFVCFPLIRTYVLGVEMVETANPTLYVLFLSNFDQINQYYLFPSVRPIFHDREPSRRFDDRRF